MTEIRADRERLYPPFPSPSGQWTEGYTRPLTIPLLGWRTDNNEDTVFS